MQSLFGKKQQQSEGKSIKKYLSESLIGPVSQAGNMTQDQKNDLLSQINSTESSSVNPFAKGQMLSNDPTNRSDMQVKSEAQPLKEIPKCNPEPSPNTNSLASNMKQESSQSRNILEFIQGDYFQGASSVTKSFAFGTFKNVESEGKQSFARESSFATNPKQLASTIRRQRIGSLEINIKETAPPNDSGLVYDYILHHSEVNSRSGTKAKGKIFINNYLDMDSIKSDDLSHYSSHDKDFSHPSRSFYSPVKKNSFEIKKYKKEEDQAQVIDPNASILENVQVFSENYYGVQSEIDKETLDLVENLTLDDEEDRRKMKEIEKHNINRKEEDKTKIPNEKSQQCKSSIQSENVVKSFNFEPKDQQPEKGINIFHQIHFTLEYHKTVCPSIPVKKIEKLEIGLRKSEPEMDTTNNQKVEQVHQNKDKQKSPSIERMSDLDKNNVNIRVQEFESPLRAIEKGNQNDTAVVSSTDKDTQGNNNFKQKFIEEDELLKTQFEKKSISPMTKPENQIQENDTIETELPEELDERKSFKAESISLDSRSSYSSTKGSFIESSPLKEKLEESNQSKGENFEIKSPTSNKKNELEETKEETDVSPDQSQRSFILFQESFASATSKEVQNMYLGSQTDFKDEDLNHTQKRNTIRILSGHDAIKNDRNTAYTLEKAIIKQHDKLKETNEDLNKTDEEENLNMLNSENLESKGMMKVPKDPLDDFDNEDNGEGQTTTSQNLQDYLIVSQNPLISSYKLNITSIIPCKGVSEQLYSTEGKKTKKYDVTLIKFAPPGYIFVGTTSSTILIFDANENLLKVLKYSDGPQQMVTALDFFVDDTDTPLIVVGFSGGHIVAYDLKTFNVFKAITNVQTGKITSIKIIKPDPLLFMCSDESGQVVRYQVQKMLWFNTEEHRFLVESGTIAFDIQCLAKEMRARSSTSLAEEGELRYIFALAKFEKILVLDSRDCVTSDVAKSIFVFNKPEYIPDGTMPTLSWGNGSFQNFTRKTFLAIGWGSIIHLLKFTFVDSKPAFLYVGYFKLEGALIRNITWVHENTLAVIDQNDILYFIQSEDFIEGEYQYSNDNQSENKEESKNKVYTYPLGDKLRAKLSFADSKKVLRIFYGGSIHTSWKTHEMLILGESSVYKVRPMSALEYLDNLCKNNEWLKFLTVGLQVYRLNIKEFRVPLDLAKRRNFMLPFFREKIGTYLEEQFKKEGESKEYYQEFMLSLIDFFVEIEDSEFLFNFCLRKVTEFSLQDIFLECLEPFLLNGKVKYIPDGQLKSVIIYYCNNDKRSLMQKLLRNLDIEKQDCFILLHLCLEYNFYTVLIDICSKVDDNYITPFIKLTNDYYTAKALNQETEARNYGYRCLWYLKLCINKKLIPKFELEQVKHDRWKNIMFQLMVMIFEPKNLQLLFEVDGELSICLMLLFFIGDLAELVEEKYGDFLIGQVSSKEGNSDDIHFQVYQALKNGLKMFSSDKQKDLYFHQLGFFHGKVAQLLRYAFLDRELCVEIVKRFINNPYFITDRLLLSWEKTRLQYEGNSTKEIQNYFETKVTPQFISSQRIAVILDLLKYCQFTLTSQDISSLLNRAHESNLIEVECMLLTMKGNYRDCLDTYLSVRAPFHHKSKVFEWITQTFRIFIDKPDKLQHEKQGIEELKIALLDRFPLLLSLDKEQTKLIIDEFLIDKIRIVLRKLRLDSKLQLEVLEKFIAKHDEKKKIDAELLILHIHLLALSGKKNAKRIKDVIQRSNRYPLDACLEICQENDIKDAWAYLELKRGEVYKAIGIVVESLEKSIKKYLSRESFKYNDKKEKISSVVKTLLDYLCQINRNPEKVWFETISRLYRLMEENLERLNRENKKIICAEFEAMKSNVIELMLDNLANLDTREMLKAVNDKTLQIPETLKGKVLTQLVLQNAHENFILEFCESLVREDILLFNNIQLFPRAICGTYQLPSCQTCYKTFHRDDYALWFGCGHLFHSSQNCCPGGKCPTCKTSIPTLIRKFTLSKTQANRALSSQGINNIGEQSGEKSEIILKTTKDSHKDQYKYKMTRFNQFYNFKVKKQKEFNKVAEKYLS